jgi:dihydroorotate dehydrogenase (fumarate)
MRLAEGRHSGGREAVPVLANIAMRLDQAGTHGLVLFNRFYQPEIDIDALEIIPSLALSQSHELPLRLHWVAILYGSVRASLAITGGVHSCGDVLKAMMAGANAAMMTSAFFQNGICDAKVVLHEMFRWMEEHDSIDAREHELALRAQPVGIRSRQHVRVLSSFAPSPRRF